MPLDTYSSEEISDFLEKSRLFWARNDLARRGGGEACVTVDLAHEGLAYLHTNIVIAKAIQYALGVKNIVGIFKSWSKVIKNYDINSNKELAKSFGIDDFVDLDSAAGGDDKAVETADRFFADISTHGERWREWLIDQKMDWNEHFGLSIYDTRIREELRVDIGPQDSELHALIRESALAMSRMQRGMKGRKIVAHVTGHLHYAPYIIPSAFALKEGATVYYQQCLRPVNLVRIETQRELLDGRPARFIDWFSSTFAAAAARSPLLSRYRDNPRGLAISEREDLRAETDVPLVLRRERPTVVILSHAITDDVHGFGRYEYIDFADWLSSTLDYCANIEGVDFVVKPHPINAAYDRVGYLDALASKYAGHPSIRFLGSESIDWQASNVAFGVTVHGAAGFELSALGVPMVCLSRYRDLGFARIPGSRAEYESWLQNPMSVPRLTRAEQDAAILYGFFDWAGGRSKSRMLPGIRNESSDYLRAVMDAMENLSLDEDDLFRSVEYMTQNNAPSLLNWSLIHNEKRWHRILGLFGLTRRQ